MRIDRIEDGGGYDLSEIQQAKESLESNARQVEEVKKVEPMYIQVRRANVSYSEEMGTREVFLDYDELGNIVGVELL